MYTIFKKILSPHRLALIKNAQFLLIERVIQLVVNIFTVSLIARYLGPTDFGLLNYSVAFYELISFFADLGVDNIAVREIIRRENQIPKILGSLFTLKIAGSLLAAILIFVFNSGDCRQVFIIYIISSSLLVDPFKVIEFYFQAKMDIKTIVFSRIGPFILCSLLKILFIYLKVSFVYFAIVIVIENVLNSVLLFLCYSRRPFLCKIQEWRPQKALIFRLLKDSFPLLFSGAFKVAILRLDQIMLSNMVNVTALGYYSAAYKISHALFFIPHILFSTCYPSIVSAKEQSMELYQARLISYYKLNSIISFLPVISITVLSPFIIRSLFGEDYAPSIFILIIQAWSIIFISMGSARSAYLLTENKTKIHSFCMALGCIINVALNWLLIPRFEGIGAAIASLLAFFISGCLSGFFFKDVRNQSIILIKAFLFPFQLKQVFHELLRVVKSKGGGL